MLWYGSREYDPAIGRFISPDSIVPDGPQGYDRYAYVNNDPVRYNDPTGHSVGCGVFCTWWYGGDDGYKGSGWGYPIRQMIAKALNVDGNAGNWQTEWAHGLLEQNEVHLVGQALEDLKIDPKLLALQDKLIARAESDPRYGQEAYTPHPSIGNSVTFGESGTNNMLVDATNEDTWTVRAAEVDANLNVDAQGAITINYHVDDTLDLKPDWTSGVRTGFSGFAYNVVTTIAGPIWTNNLGGNDQMKVYADWTTQIDPTEVGNQPR